MWTFTGVPRLDSETPSSTFREYAAFGSTDHGLILRGLAPVTLYLTPSTSVVERESVLFEDDGNRVDLNTALPSTGPIQTGSVIYSAHLQWGDNLSQFEAGFIYNDRYFIYKRSTALALEVAHVQRTAFGNGPVNGASVVSGSLVLTVNPHTGLAWQPEDFSSLSDYEIEVQRDDFTGMPSVYKFFALGAVVAYDPPPTPPVPVVLPPVPGRVTLEQGDA